MNGNRIIKAAIPDASDDLIDHIIWDRTAYPFERMTPRLLYRAASRWRRASEGGKQLCEMCDRIAVTRFMCGPCSVGPPHEPSPPQSPNPPPIRREL